MHNRILAEIATFRSREGTRSGDGADLRATLGADFRATLGATLGADIRATLDATLGADRAVHTRVVDRPSLVRGGRPCGGRAVTGR